MTQEVDVYIGVGSNLNRPVQQVTGALQQLRRLPRSRHIADSMLYWSEPLGGMDQPRYVNAATRLKTLLSPGELLRQLQQIERDHGRIRNSERWAARTLDLDLLVVGEFMLDEPDLIVPHPGITQRAFVLVPLYELNPELVIPGVGAVKAWITTDVKAQLTVV